ncbi:MAG: nucleoside deaminase [Bacilli bacterium]
MNKQILNALIRETNKAIIKDEVPVGCVITKKSKIISRGYNQKISKNDPTAHAEIVAIKRACKKIGSWNLNDCELYVTLKPCNMCLSVINEARIKKIYYLVDNIKNVNNNMIITKINNKKYEEFFSNTISTFFKKKR